MPSIFDMIASHLGDGQLDQIAKKIGADKAQTSDAISMSLPALIEALGRKTEQAGGVEDLHKKLGQAGRTGQASNTGGSMLDQLNDILGQESAPASRSAPTTAQQPQRGNDRGDILPPTSAPATRTSGASPTHAQPVPRQPIPQQPIPQQPIPQQPSSALPDIFGDLLGNKHGRVSDAVSKSSGLNKEQAGSLISMLGPMLSGILENQANSQKMSPADLTEMLRNDRAKVQQSPGGGMIGKMLDQDGDGDFDMNDMMKLGMGMLFKK